MINMLGGNQVYTVSEVNELLDNMYGFLVADTLPSVSNAKENIIYFLVTGDSVTNDTGKTIPVVTPYVIHNGNWQVASDINYTNLKNIPTINGKKITGDINKETATNTYDMVISEESIKRAVANAWS